MNNCLYDINSAWSDRVEDPAEIGRKFLQTLDQLSHAGPMFRDWGTCDAENTAKGQPIDPMRSNFTPWVEANVWIDDWGKPDPDDGYWIWAATRYRPYAPADPKSLSFHLAAGSRWKNHYTLEAGRMGKAPDPAVVTYPAFKAALLTTISIWPAPWANLRASIWGEDPPTLPGEPPFPKSGYQMPWISYLCAERAAKLDLPHDVLTERTPDGGLLMIAAETRFDPSNRDHMARSKILAEIMIQLGGDPYW